MARMPRAQDPDAVARRIGAADVDDHRLVRPHVDERQRLLPARRRVHVEVGAQLADDAAQRRRRLRHHEHAQGPALGLVAERAPHHLEELVRRRRLVQHVRRVEEIADRLRLVGARPHHDGNAVERKLRPHRPLEAPEEGHGEPYAQLWFARFDRAEPERTFGFNKKFPIAELRQEPAPFRVRIADGELTATSARGHLGGEGHEASWDLTWSASDRVHQHLPPSVYKASFADTLVQSPNLNAACRGTITVDGQRYDLDGDPLGQTHLWGRKHAYSWAWSHCNAFDGDRGAALETLSVRLRRGPVVLPKLTLLSLCLDGSDPAELHFRDFWKLPLSRSDYGTGRYQLHAADAQWKIEAELTCRPDDMIMAEYVDPDGEPAYCHNTECADARVTVWRRSPFVGRFRQHRTLASSAGAHFEWAARAGYPLVRKRHVPTAPYHVIV